MNQEAMDALKQCEELVRQSQLACGVVGTPALDQFELIDAAAMTYQAAVDAARRGLVFVGVLTIIDGAPRSTFVVEVSDEAVKAIADLFAERVATEVAGRLEVRQLQQLYGLPDPRSEN